MVRRAAARDMSALVKRMSPEVIINEMLPLYLRLSADDQDMAQLHI